MMNDIFDAVIMCRECREEMAKSEVEREGFIFRVMECPNCKDRILHPDDVNAFNQFKNIRGKTFMVKLRVVGNSHAISIPKEIVDFINEPHRQMKRNMDDMVKLCFEDFETLKLRFGE